MRYISVTSPDINNGTGFRVTLWVAGCSRHCKGCHNPETWDYNQGTNKILKKVLEALKPNYIQGLTISGGDPLLQDVKSLKQLYHLLRIVKFKYPKKDIWIYSSEIYEEAIQDKWKRKILDLCDVMVDGPYKSYLRDTSLAFRGSSNQRIINLCK
jgi:anaerobic ribonucleoside-triphosphate reductase activating protein